MMCWVVVLGYAPSLPCNGTPHKGADLPSDLQPPNKRAFSSLAQDIDRINASGMALRLSLNYYIPIPLIPSTIQVPSEGAEL